jgi:TonB family protein
MLGENEQLQVDLAGLDADSDANRRRMLALTLLLLLLVALIFAAVKYRQFWFESLSFQDTGEQTTSKKVQVNQGNVIPTPSRKSRSSGKQHKQSVSETQMAESSMQEVLSAPLQVDVTYAGGRHKTLLARDSAIHLDLPNHLRQSITASPVDAGSGVINAAERDSDSLQRTEAVVRPVEPVYPLLAQRMKVQGSVVLQARIGKDGSVQSLEVVSGPDILANAALEAVRQWRFKPAYEAGRAVPAEARITVNFTISTR